MKTKSIAFLTALVPLLAAAGTFPDFGYQPPSDWEGEVFLLSQNYPASLPAATAMPWESIDYTTDPKGYLTAVLGYCFEGNLEAKFRPQDNQIRNWYHAPWLHFGNNGREFVNGLTRERSSRPFELSPDQSSTYRNFAVGFYNEPGGYAIGKVWEDPEKPKAEASSFAEGTVTFKLLFTTAPASAVPYLQGAPEWVADIDRSNDSARISSTKVRLLQIDIAVKDKRSLAGGWVFGTFHYDAGMPGSDPWTKLRPLALTWGNDPTLTESAHAGGAKPVESWVDPDSPIVKYRQNPPSGLTPPKVMGWAGRANGPVDNPLSSCISCHMTAQHEANSPMLPPNGSTEEQRLRWFRNLPPGAPFDEGSVSLDFSLQIGVGIQNLEDFQDLQANLGGFRASDRAKAARFLKANEKPAADWIRPQARKYRFGRDPFSD